MAPSEGYNNNNKIYLLSLLFQGSEEKRRYPRCALVHVKVVMDKVGLSAARMRILGIKCAVTTDTKPIMKVLLQNVPSHSCGLQL